MNTSPLLILGLGAATAAFTASLYGAPAAPAARAANVQAAAAAPAVPAAPPATAPGARRGGRGRPSPNLGPVPEIHAPVPNTLPGLLGKGLKWKSTGPLISPVSDSSHYLHSIKDPTLFFHDNRWEVYATAHMINGPAAAALLNPPAGQPAGGGRGGTFKMIHTSFPDWKDAPSAKLHYMDADPTFAGYGCAPEVISFTPHKKWYLIYQTQPPVYCTSDTPGDPMSWSKPQPFFAPGTPMPNLPIDFHLIGDGAHMYLFFTGDDGNFYRSRTTYADFPKGMSNPVIAMRGTRETVFEAGSTYKIKGADKYLTIVEALSPTRYFRAYVADKLDGEWYPVEGFDTFQHPFAGGNNMSFEDGVSPWTNQVSHGEMVRESSDERMILDPNNLLFLYQGMAAGAGGDYGQLPYKVGLLRAVKPN
jgi:hypothetical protein